MKKNCDLKSTWISILFLLYCNRW